MVYSSRSINRFNAEMSDSIGEYTVKYLLGYTQEELIQVKVREKRQTCWKVEREARIEPPIHTEYFLSGGAMILIFMVLGANAVISF